MNLDDQINTIHTPCKNCVFAIYDNKTQNGCAIDYLSVYKNKNISLLEAYDDEKEFYIVNGKKCIGYRENKWFKQFGLENADLEDKIKKYKETNKLDYLITIDLKKLSLDDVDSLLGQISKCRIQPKKVILIRYADNELKFPYAKLEALFKKYDTAYVWRIQTILDLTTEYADILHNIISLNHKFRFILSVVNHNNDIERIVDYTNNLVHNDLEQFEIISNQDHTAIIFSSIIYRFEAFHHKEFLNKKENYKIV